MIKLRLSAFIVLLLFTLIACKKEATTTPNDFFIKSTTQKQKDSLGYTRFTYDNQNRLTAILDSNNNGHTYKTDIEYDGQGRLTTATYSSSSSLAKYSYLFVYDNNGRVVQKLDTPPSSAYTNPLRNTYAYDSKGRLIADTAYSYWSPDIYKYTSYIYDDKDNVVEQKTFGNNAGTFQAQGSMQSQFDNKTNPYHRLGLLLYFIGGDINSLNKNNWITKSFPDGTKVSFDYQYNNNGLPISYTEKDNTDPLITYHEIFY